MKITSEIITGCISYLNGNNDFIPYLDQRDNDPNLSIQSIECDVIGEVEGKIFLACSYDFKTTGQGALTKEDLRANVKYNRSNGSYKLMQVTEHQELN